MPPMWRLKSLLRLFPGTYGKTVDLKRARVSGLSVDEKCMILRLLVLTQCYHVTDGQTDMLPIVKSHTGIAECGKNSHHF